MYAKITKDLLFDGKIITSDRSGMVVIGREEDKSTAEIIVCRLLDDDRIPYYMAVSDDEALEELFYWAMRDSGCTILQTRGDGGWRDALS